MRLVVDRTAAAIAKSIATIVAEQLDAQLRDGGRAVRRSKNGVRHVAAWSHTEIRKWSADRRARRVPNFVIEATGLDTKKKIVAKYGENATFERGKPPPKPK